MKRSPSRLSQRLVIRPRTSLRTASAISMARNRQTLGSGARVDDLVDNQLGHPQLSDGDTGGDEAQRQGAGGEQRAGLPDHS